MNTLNDISDEDFVPFLHRLGVETYKKSFEWMLNDPAFADVLRWLYTNLDQNNALSLREEYRYVEIEKSGLLTSTELDSTLASILEEYPGVCLPGDKDAKEDVNLDISMQKDRVELLEKQMNVLEDMVNQNESTREQLNLEVIKLNAAQQQCSEDESLAADECLQLAQEVENITEGVIDVIAQTLDVYSSCNSDKDISKKFFTFGPFEAYRQTQELFKSHFDLYTSMRFNQKDNPTDEGLRLAVLEAKNMEDRLNDAALTFIESKAELCGEQAKLALVANYNNVHPYQVATCSMESQSALELLEQEELILDQQIQDAVKSLVKVRTKIAMDAVGVSALSIREKLHSNLSHLLETTHHALTLDRVLYCSLRHELRTLEELLQFTSHLRRHVIYEEESVCSRIESMNVICTEQEICEQRLQSNDRLIDTLCTLLGLPVTNDEMQLVKYYSDLQSNLTELKENIYEGFNTKEIIIKEFVNSTRPLRDFIWDGCTKQPNCWDRTVAALSHSLRQEMERVDKRVIEASGRFTTVKNGDKKCMRKLWQWFLTDPNKLIAAMKRVARNYQ